MSTQKVKPIARIVDRRDGDGWHSWKGIDYYCPVCKKLLKGYGDPVGCVDCGIFFDWGNKEPKLVTRYEIEGW